MKLLLVLSLLAATPLAAADCEPLAGQTIRWLVPTRPGGGYDAYSRLLQPFLEQRLDARIVIENRSEAGGIVAAMTLRDAPADGTTIGIINASGLLAANIVADAPAPDPSTDFTILGRVISNHVVLFTGRDSGISDIHGLVQLSRTRPVVVGVRDTGSASFFAVPITASLIGMDYAMVTGYVGNAARTLAAIRGEVDVVLHHFGSARRYVEAGELIPLLQVTVPAGGGTGEDAHAMLVGVPALAGMDGLARQRAPARGKPPDQAGREAAALASIIGAGRLIVAPPGLPGAVGDCLATALGEVLDSEELLAAAGRAQLRIAPASAAAARSDLLQGASALRQFAPLVRAAIDEARR